MKIDLMDNTCRVKLVTTVVVATLFCIVSFESTGQNAFKDFTEFQAGAASLTYNFQFKKRTAGDIFMTGGIYNYRAKKITPASATAKVEKEIWGVIVNDTIYINSYPFSRLKGFNKIEGKGFYTFFIGEPARTKNEQIKLGIIKSGEQQLTVCCQTGYVILPDGTVKHLRPEVLLDLCKDNGALAKEISAANLKIEDVERMFNFLRRYNATK